ncbi:MAG TPA: DUF6249 domain-containing protein [Casimicrobiaceae bacterium]|nr:DUF6249 domain-containing protein [Casimicrobiaceae bacterium]
MSAFSDPLALRRPLVLGFALVAALGALAVTPPAPSLVTPAYGQAPADARPSKAPAAQGDASSATPTPQAGSAAAGSAPVPGTATAPDAATNDDADDVEAPPPAAKRRHKSGSLGITLGDDDKVNIRAFGRAHEYDSFSDFVEKAPWIAGLFFLGVLLVFLVPLLVIILVLWYKMRKTRMLNDTMLKLAEKGVVPPAEAMDAIGATRPQAALAAGQTTSELYARARSIRARNVWSDLRRGIVLVAVGLAVQTCSMLENGEASGVGLVLLFLGIGYVVLWYFEDRRDPVPPRVDTGGDRAP